MAFPLECGDVSTPARLPRRGPRLSPLLPAAAWRRFLTVNSIYEGCDRSQPTKAVTGHRTPC
jgi:hypothetical protein